MNLKTFSITLDNKTVELMVRLPSLQDQREATKIYNQAFTEALKSKAIVRAKLDDLLVEQGLWDNSKQAQFTELQNKILEGERQLAKGGIKLAEAKNIALGMKKNREEIRDLISVKTNLDNHTAEGQADNARFNYLVSACTIYADSKEPYFKNYEDYNNRSSDPATILAAQNLANMLYGLEENYENKLPENKFLKDYKFVDDNLKLINKEGKLIDEDGRLIDSNGRFINENGQFVDKDGNLVNESGDYIVEFTPFLDDNNSPVVINNTNNEDNKDTAVSSNKE